MTKSQNCTTNTSINWYCVSLKFFINRKTRKVTEEGYRSIQEEAQKQEKRAIALNFLRDGLSVEVVARGTGLLVEEVQQLQQQMDKSSQNWSHYALLFRSHRITDHCSIVRTVNRCLGIGNVGINCTLEAVVISKELTASTGDLMHTLCSGNAISNRW